MSDAAGVAANEAGQGSTTLPAPFRLSPPQRLLVAGAVLLPPLLGLVVLLSGGPGWAWRRLVLRDAGEPNDTLAEAQSIGPGRTDASCSPGDVDFYRVRVPAGAALQVALESEQLLVAGGRLSLHDPERGPALDWVEAPGRLCWVPPPGGGEVAVSVVGDLGRYRLIVTLTDPGARFEPNGRGAVPPRLSAGAHEGIRLHGEDDFAVLLPPLRPVRVRLTGDPRAVIQLSSARDGQGPLARGREGVFPARAVRGEGGLQVLGPPDCVYGLVVEPLPATLALAAPEASAVVDGPREPNDDPSDCPVLGPGLHTGLGCDGIDHYRFRAPAAGVLEARLLPGGRQDSFQALSLVLLDQTSGSSGMRAPVQAGQEVLLVVHGMRGMTPVPYALRLSLLPAPGAAAALVPGVSTRVCTGEDRSTLALAPGETAHVTLGWDRTRGQLSLTVGGTRLGDEQQQFDPASGTWRNEAELGELSTSFTAFRAESLPVIVEGDRIPYDLQVQIDPRPDASQPERQPLRQLPAAGRHEVLLGVQSRQRVDVELRGEVPTQDVDLYLYDENNTQLVSSTSSRHLESVRWTARADGTLRVQVTGPSGAAYRLRVSVSDPVDLDQPLVAGLHTDLPLAGVTELPLELAEDDFLTVVASPGQGEDPLAMPLSLTLLDAQRVELATSDGEQPLLSTTIPSTGSYWLRVEGPPGLTGRFDLKVQIDR